MIFGSQTILQKKKQIINILSPEIRNDVKSFQKYKKLGHKRKQIFRHKPLKRLKF